MNEFESKNVSLECAEFSDFLLCKFRSWKDTKAIIGDDVDIEKLSIKEKRIMACQVFDFSERKAQVLKQLSVQIKKFDISYCIHLMDKLFDREMRIKEEKYGGDESLAYKDSELMFAGDSVEFFRYAVEPFLYITNMADAGNRDLSIAEWCTEYFKKDAEILEVAKEKGVKIQSNYYMTPYDWRYTSDSGNSLFGNFRLWTIDNDSDFEYYTDKKMLDYLERIKLPPEEGSDHPDN